MRDRENCVCVVSVIVVDESMSLMSMIHCQNTDDYLLNDFEGIIVGCSWVEGYKRVIGAIRNEETSLNFQENCHLN
jgi:hypothetical protein